MEPQKGKTYTGLKTVFWVALAMLLYYSALVIGEVLIAVIFMIQDLASGMLCVGPLGELFYDGMAAMESEAFLIRYSYAGAGYATLLAVPVVVFGFWFLRKKQNVFATETPPYYKRFSVMPNVWAFLAGVSANVLIAFVVAHTFLQDVSPDTNAAFDAMFLNTPFWLLVLGTAVATPIMEEMTFRGFIYTRLQTTAQAWTRHSHIVAIVLQALLFGLIHMNLQQFVYASVLGILFGIMRYSTRSVWPGIFAHFGFNLFSVGMYEITKYAEEWSFAGWFAELYDNSLVWVALPVFLVSMILFGITVKMQQKNAGKTSQNQSNLL